MRWGTHAQTQACVHKHAALNTQDLTQKRETMHFAHCLAQLWPAAYGLMEV